MDEDSEATSDAPSDAGSGRESDAASDATSNPPPSSSTRRRHSSSARPVRGNFDNPDSGHGVYPSPYSDNYLSASREPPAIETTDAPSSAGRSRWWFMSLSHHYCTCGLLCRRELPVATFQLHQSTRPIPIRERLETESGVVIPPPSPHPNDALHAHLLHMDDFPSRNLMSSRSSRNVIRDHQIRHNEPQGIAPSATPAPHSPTETEEEEEIEIEEEEIEED